MIKLQKILLKASEFLNNQKVNVWSMMSTDLNWIERLGMNINEKYKNDDHSTKRKSKAFWVYKINPLNVCADTSQ